MTIGKLSGQCDFGQKGQSYCNQRGQSCVAKRVKVAWLFHLSRNPMYFFYEVGALAVCIASASLWLLLATIPLILVTHGVILGEERYCMTTYGEDYARYKARTPRYFLLK